MKSVLSCAAVFALLFSSACTQSPEKLIATGNRYHDKKKYKEASILYQKAIAKDKTNAEAYYRQGLNLLDDGNLGEATRFLRRAVDLKPDNIDAASKLAEIYLGAYATNPKKFKNFLTDSQELDDKILQAQPNSFEGIRIQALLYLANNDREKALESFARANSIKPHSREMIGWYADALVGAGRGTEAETLVRDMLAHDKTWGPGYDFLFVYYNRQKDQAKSEAILRDRVANDGSNPVAVQNLSGYLLSQNRFDEAEGVLKQALNNKSSFPKGHEMLGDFYMRARKYDLALAQYEAGMKEEPKDALEYRQRTVNAYQLTGRHDEAMKLARSLATDNPKNASASEMYAALLMQSGNGADAAKALDQLKTLVSNNPNDGALHFQLARSYFSARQTDKALSESLEALSNEVKAKPIRPIVIVGARALAGRIYEDRGDHAKALEQADAILTTDPRNPEARLLRDRALIGTNQADKAQGDLEALVNEYPGMNDAHVNLAGIYVSAHQLEKAKAEFQKVASTNPPDPRGMIGLQVVKFSEGKFEDAIAGLRDLVEKHPDAPGYRQQLANFEASAGAESTRNNPQTASRYFTSAIDDYKELLKTNSKDAETWLRLGVLQRQMSHLDDALVSFTKAAEIDPRNVNVLLNQGMLQEATGKKSEAAATYNRILGFDPDNPLALNNVAFMDAEKGTNLDQAMTFAERAKKRAPNSPDISDTLGYVYLQKNLNSEAVRIFRDVVEQNPNNPTYHFHLAMALLKQGDKQAARAEAEKALQHAPQPEQQDKIRSFVNQIG